jgi:hypothetical protein
MEISSTSGPKLTPKTILRQTDDNIRREPIRVNSDKGERKTSYLVEVVDLRKLDKNYQQVQKQVPIESMDFKYQKALKTYQNIYFQANNRRHIDFYV